MNSLKEKIIFDIIPKISSEIIENEIFHKGDIVECINSFNRGLEGLQEGERYIVDFVGYSTLWVKSEDNKVLSSGYSARFRKVEE